MLQYFFSAAVLLADEHIPVLASRTSDIGSVLSDHKYQIDITPYYYGYYGNDNNYWSMNALFSMAFCSNWQFEASIDPFSYESSETGISDLLVGVKWSQRENPINLVWSGYLSVPSGSEKYRGDLAPSLYLTANSDFFADIDLSLTIGTTYTKESQQDFFSLEWSTCLSFPVDTDTMNIFHSGYTVGPDSDGGNRMNIGAGFTHFLSECISIDATIMKGLTSAGMDWSYMLSWSYRF